MELNLKIYVAYTEDRLMEENEYYKRANFFGLSTVVGTLNLMKLGLTMLLNYPTIKKRSGFDYSRWTKQTFSKN